MYLEELRLYQFRNLADQTVTLQNGTCFFRGRNANGKTNLVEAVSLISTGKSFRTSSSRELIRAGCASASVFGKSREENGQIELGIVLTGKSREAFVNSEKVKSLGEFLGKLPTVTFVPGDLLVIKGPPSGRRKFIDKHLIDVEPRLIPHMVQYGRALERKNAVLRGENVREDEITPWNKLMAEAAEPLMKSRYKFLEELKRRVNLIHTEYAPLDGWVELSWDSTLPYSPDITAAEIEKAFADAFSREAHQRTSVVGLHRDDIKIQLGDLDARAYASQGQTRSLILSLKLAVVEMIEENRKESPIVLLDDVDSELDRFRAEALFAFLLNKSRQVLITGTEIPDYESVQSHKVQAFLIEHGAVTPEG